jgi:hypothetical protein
MGDKIARLRVTVDEVTPAVVRRVEVPLDIRLDDLHFVLQVAIGWQNCHPFEFRPAGTNGNTSDGKQSNDKTANGNASINKTSNDTSADGNSSNDKTANGKSWGLIDRDDPQAERLAAENATLADLVALGHVFHYDYVYGEDWTHTVELEAVADAVPAAKYPSLLSAQGRCPPADIGGVDGYENFLRAIADPNHLHHEAMRDWDDPEFDPARVDEVALRANLADLGKYLGRRKR